VRKSAAAWPLGIPVPAFGLVGYIILAICSFLRTFSHSSNNSHKSTPDTLQTFHFINFQLLTRIMRGVAIFGVLFVSWFTYTELFVIHGICTWCAISTVVMYVIASLLFYEWRQKTSNNSVILSRVKLDEGSR